VPRPAILSEMSLAVDRSRVRLLFVCTGNICRSAAADRLATKWATDTGARVSVRSAGTRAVAGRPVHPRTERALERYGVRGDKFSSRPLTAHDIDWADVVLTMTSQHREEVVAVTPRGLHKVFMLLEAARLLQTMPPGRLEGVTSGSGGGMLADALREARSRHARPRGAVCDVVDPIDGSARLHLQVVDQIAEAVGALVNALQRPPVTDETVRVHRLPPVPRAR
jgi:protein-tyrosine-phosphatase